MILSSLGCYSLLIETYGTIHVAISHLPRSKSQLLYQESDLKDVVRKARSTVTVGFEPCANSCSLFGIISISPFIGSFDVFLVTSLFLFLGQLCTPLSQNLWFLTFVYAFADMKACLASTNANRNTVTNVVTS